jgi:hypothetical protein
MNLPTSSHADLMTEAEREEWAAALEDLADARKRRERIMNRLRVRAHRQRRT